MQISYIKKWEEAREAYKLVPNEKLKEEIEILWEQAFYSGEFNNLLRVPLEKYETKLLKDYPICK